MSVFVPPDKAAVSKGFECVGGAVLPLILTQNTFQSKPRAAIPKQSDALLQRTKVLNAIALRNRTLEAVEVSDDRFTVEIRLQIPITFSRAELDRLLQQTDGWPGWGDSPSQCLSKLGVLIEGAIAVGGAA